MKSDADVTNYFNSTIEADELHDPLPRYYALEFGLDKIEDNRNMVWESWRRANAQRLTQWLKIQDETIKDSIIWQIGDQNKMLFALIKKDSMPAGGYPLFINLHGGGCYPKEQGPWTSPMNNREWAAAKALSQKYEDSPSLHFVPRMIDDRRGRWYHSTSMRAFIRAWQLGVLSGEINPDRTYIMGISEGGYGSFRMGVFFADYFAGAGPMAGPVWVDQEPIENLRNTAFRIEVGEYDNAYSRAKNGQDWKDALDSAASHNPGQFIHQVEIQQGRGHGINYSKTSPWLKKFTRNPYPDTLSAVFYSECDSIYAGEPNVACTYRKGFGYLRFDGLSQTGQRSFKVEKTGNQYNVTSNSVQGSVTGTIKIYVDKVDFSKPVSVVYNDKRIFSKNIKPNQGTMMESMALFGDPKRIFPASVTIQVENEK